MSSSLIKKACARLWRLFQKRIMLFLAPLADRLTLKDQRILDEQESFPKPLRGKASTSSLIPRPVPLICTDASCRARSEFDCSAEFEPCLLLWFQYYVWSGKRALYLPRRLILCSLLRILYTSNIFAGGTLIISDIVLVIVEFCLQALYLFLYNSLKAFDSIFDAGFMPFNSFKSSVMSKFVFLYVFHWVIFCFMHIPVGSTSPKINTFI